MADTTPMMQQYNSIKRDHPDGIVFFRLGDFYEMFHGDAVKASKILGITLTKRHDIPMCGVPHHSSRSYIQRLLQAGVKVVLVEQTTPPGKGLVQRAVSEIITPGTILDPDFIPSGTANYVASITHQKNKAWAISFADISTGQAHYFSGQGDDGIQRIQSLVAVYSPREYVLHDIYGDAAHWIEDLVGGHQGTAIRFPPWYFDPQKGYEKLTQLMGTANLKGFGIDEPSVVTGALGAMFTYIAENTMKQPHGFFTIKAIEDQSFLMVDRISAKNLEIQWSNDPSQEDYSLFTAINQTKTAPGARLLRQWLAMPLRDVRAIAKRYDAVDQFYHDQLLLQQVREQLAAIVDLERLCSKLAYDKAHPRDISNLCQSVLSSGELLSHLIDGNEPLGIFCPSIKQGGGSSSAMATCEQVLKKLHDPPPTSTSEVPIFLPAVDQNLDELRAFQRDSTDILDRHLDEVREASKNPGMKLKFNKLIGYFFEATKSQTTFEYPGLVLRQSLVNNKRYTTETLGTINDKLLSLEQEILHKEQQLFYEACGSIKEHLSWILQLARDVASVDVLQSFGYQALLRSYCRPQLHVKKSIHLIEARHPVVEQHIRRGSFTPNDLHLEPTRPFLMLTGPNMAGKSTYLRQTALIAIMAHAGSFVPAREALIGEVDRVFTRIGASDNISKGESTFLVEMNETAHILNQASEKSLIIMDEVGRGTSTEEGFALAYAICEHLIHQVKARTLFATHIHQLTEIDSKRIQNWSMAVEHSGDSIRFLHSIVPGASNRSYGIHVAGLAGVPPSVLTRAEQLLLRTNMQINTAETPTSTKQPELFETRDQVTLLLENSDPNGLTPLEALQLLFTLKNMSDKKN